MSNYIKIVNKKGGVNKKIDIFKLSSTMNNTGTKAKVSVADPSFSKRHRVPGPDPQQRT
jgi:hypothetical protein